MPSLLTSVDHCGHGDPPSAWPGAVASLSVDWQVLLVPGADPAMVIDAIGKSVRYEALQSVGYADTEGFSATTGGTSQTTGPGKVLGLEADYRQLFPGQIQLELGSWDGVLITTQTAANLHVAPDDMVTIQPVGGSPVMSGSAAS
jgi:putative ABC transport system permease protein